MRSFAVPITVNPHGDIFDLSNPADYPWRRCQSASECIAWTQDLNNDRTTFDLTIEIMGKYLIDKESDCSTFNRCARIVSDSGLSDGRGGRWSH